MNYKTILTCLLIVSVLYEPSLIFSMQLAKQSIKRSIKQPTKQQAEKPANPSTKKMQEMALCELHGASRRYGNDDLYKDIIISCSDINGKDDNGTTSLHYAVQNGLTNLVEALINAGADVHAQDGCNFSLTSKATICTPLHYAAQNGRVEIAEFLIENGADVNAKDGNGNSVLHYASASFRNSASIINLLIEKGAHVHAINNARVTPLHNASHEGHLDVIEILIGKGADVRAEDNKQQTPMHYCERHINVKKLLIDHGADPNTKFSSGFTPLFDAVSAKDIPFVRILIGKGANVDAHDSQGNTPLRYATLKSTPNMIELLFAAGADVNAMDGMGQTPLFDACRNGNYDNARTLIESGAHVNIKGVPFYEYPQTTNEIPCCWGPDCEPKVLVPHFCIGDGASGDKASDGLTPLHIACFNGHDKIVDLLIRHGADGNSAGDRNGTTPLHMAARKGHVSIIKKLFKARSKTNSATIEPGASTPESLSFDKMYFIGDGITPLFSAIGGGKLDIVKIIAPMTNVNKKAGFLEITPLHYACQFGHFDIVKELIKNKANPALLFGNKFSGIQTALCHGHNGIAQFLSGLMEKPLPKTIKNGVFVKRPSETMKVISSPYGEGRLESVIFKTCMENCLLPGQGGVYYHTPEGIKPVPVALKELMAANQLLHLNYDECKKMGNVADIKHDFHPIVEKECGDWAWVIIDNPKYNPDSIKEKNKRFDLYVTLPGSIYNENKDGQIVGRHHKDRHGAFEFKVRKTLYEEEGMCYHRFYAPKGIVGATDFGAKARVKDQKLLTSVSS